MDECDGKTKCEIFMNEVKLFNKMLYKCGKKELKKK